MEIVITGSIAFDYLMSFPGKFSEHFIPEKLDKISVSFLVNTLNKRQGGCGANIAYSLALLEEKPLLVGAVGEDFGPYNLFLKKAGVDISGIKQFENVYTASFFANTDQDNNQICSFYTGAMQFAKKVSLKGYHLKVDDLVIVSPNDPEAMMMYTNECRHLKVPFIFDPSQQIARLTGKELIQGSQGSKILILNEYELEMFLKKSGFRELDLLTLTEVLVITLGDQGSVIKTRDKEIDIPVARPERVLDPTGVGDGFRAGMMKGIIHGFSWETVGRMGSLAATYVLETESPQKHHYTLQSFSQRYLETFGNSEEIRRFIR